jgi:hypothetical protein
MGFPIIIPNKGRSGALTGHYRHWSKLTAWDYTGAEYWSDDSTPCGIMYPGDYSSNNEYGNMSSAITSALSNVDDFASTIDKEVANNSGLKYAARKFFNKIDTVLGGQMYTLNGEPKTTTTKIAASTWYIYHLVKVTDTKICMIFKYNNDIYAIAGTFSDGGNTITWGTEVAVETTQTPQDYSTDACYIGDDKVLVSYKGTSGYGSVRVLTFSGTTITAHTEAQTGDTNVTNHTSVCKVDTDKGVVAFTRNSNIDLYVVSIDGSNNCSFGTVDQHTTEAYGIVRENGTNKFWCVGTSTSNNRIHALAATVSGTTITSGSFTDFGSTTASNEYIRVNDAGYVIPIATDKLLVVAYNGSAYIATASGTTVSTHDETQLTETTVLYNGFFELTAGTVYQLMHDQTRHTVLTISSNDITETVGQETINWSSMGFDSSNEGRALTMGDDCIYVRPDSSGQGYIEYAIDDAQDSIQLRNGDGDTLIGTITKTYPYVRIDFSSLGTIGSPNMFLEFKNVTGTTKYIDVQHVICKTE